MFGAIPSSPAENHQVWILNALQQYGYLKRLNIGKPTMSMILHSKTSSQLLVVTNSVSSCVRMIQRPIEWIRLLAHVPVNKKEQAAMWENLAHRIWQKTATLLPAPRSQMSKIPSGPQQLGLGCSGAARRPKERPGGSLKSWFSDAPSIFQWEKSTPFGLLA